MAIKIRIQHMCQKYIKKGKQGKGGQGGGEGRGPGRRPGIIAMTRHVEHYRVFFISGQQPIIPGVKRFRDSRIPTN